MAHGIVCVGEFPNVALATLAQGMLEEQGIAAEVAGAAMAQTWGGEIAPFAVRLEVREEDAERARSLLATVAENEDARLETAEEDDAVGPGGSLKAAEDDEPAAPDVAEGSPAASAADFEQLVDTPGDALARRSRNAAVLGLVLSPVILYATFVLFRALGDDAEATITPKGRRWRRQAAGIVVVVFAIYTMVAMLA